MPALAYTILTIIMCHAAGCLLTLVSMVKYKKDRYRCALGLIHAAIEAVPAGADHSILELLSRVNATMCFGHLLYAPLGQDEAEDSVGQSNLRLVEHSDMHCCLGCTLPACSSRLNTKVRFVATL